VKEVFTFADLQNWQQVSAGIEPVIRLGVFGDPVEHSLSPQMHNAALCHAGLPMQYARFQIRPAELQRALRLAATLGFIGINLTVPHKHAALDLMEELATEAREIGAVNTVAIKAGLLRGCNTDGAGFRDALNSASVGFGTLAGRVVFLLGAGGAARAIARECILEKCAALFLWNRSPAKAEALRDDLETLNRGTKIVVITKENGALAGADLIVQATPIGLRADDPPLITRDQFQPRHFVYDTIYNPARTRLLIEAAAAGARVANGLSMLLHQGARAFEIWFGQPAPIDVMARALERGPLSSRANARDLSIHD
jgi:shikimate dehydrogenase